MDEATVMSSFSCCVDDDHCTEGNLDYIKVIDSESSRRRTEEEDERESNGL